MISKKIVSDVAQKARLELTDKELEQFTKELEEVLSSFHKISKLNTDNVDFSVQPVVFENHFRADVVKQKKQNVLSLGQRKDNYFKGPRLI